MSGLGQCICCSVCALFVIVIICVILSFSSLEVNTFGLDYSPITKSISPTVFTSGFHYLGFMHKFIVYPATFQTFDFSDQAGAQRPNIEARSSDGLQVGFRAQFQYQLTQGKLPELYNRYGEDYKTPCIRFAVDKMNDIAAGFPASEFFKNLQQIQTDMSTALVELFLKECFARVQSVQLSQADLPGPFEEALQNTNLAIQQQVTVKQTQKNVKIDMETKKQQAKIAAPIVKNKADAKMTALKATNLAAMDAWYQVTESQADGYKGMMTALGYDNDGGEQILKYIMVKTIGQYNQKNLIVKMEDFQAQGKKGN